MAPRCIVPLAAGALLSMGCGSREPQRTNNPPPPEPVELPPEPVTEAPPALPPWNDVSLGPPERPSTNPPIPRLVVEPNGACHKYLEDARGGMDLRHVHSVYRPSGPAYVGTHCEGDPAVAADEAEDCGQRRQCPPEAAEVLAAWRAKTAQ